MSDTPKTDTLLVQLGAAGSTSKFAEHARKMERDAEHWKRMYECAQNANAHRQAALEGHDD